eukprot:Pgem_evm1s2718
MFLLVALVSLLIFPSRSASLTLEKEQDYRKCLVASPDKVQCSANTQRECVAKGCCWNDLSPIKCYQSNELELPKLGSNNHIPKQIFQICNDKYNLSPSVQRNIKTLKERNPGYIYRLFDLKDREEYLKKYPYAYSIYKKINPEYGAALADFFRYFLLYEEGGIYLDLKANCDRSFDQVIKPNDRYILSYWGHQFDTFNNYGLSRGEISQWNIIVEKKHPALKLVVDHVIHNILIYDPEKHGVGLWGTLITTGPFTYTFVMEDYMKKYPKTHNLTLYDHYKEIGLVYNNISKQGGHLRNPDFLVKGSKHYSLLTTPLVLNEMPRIRRFVVEGRERRVASPVVIITNGFVPTSAMGSEPTEELEA